MSSSQDPPRRDAVSLFEAQLRKLGLAFPTDERGRLRIDRVADLMMRHGARLLEQFVGEREPRTPRDRKRRLILEAAIRRFGEQGYRKTSVEEVATEAGVAKGTVYLYFENKADLLMHAIALEKSRHVGGLLGVLQERTSPREKLRRYLGGAFELINEMPLLSALLSGDRELLAALEQSGFTGPWRVLDLQAGFFAWFIRRAAPDSGLPPDEIERRAKVITGLVYAARFIDDERLRNGLTRAEFARTLADMLVDGVDAPPSKAPLPPSLPSSPGRDEKPGTRGEP